jgi:predicted ester cyclase
MASTFALSRPSEKFGTHSTNVIGTKRRINQQGGSMGLQGAPDIPRPLYRLILSGRKNLLSSIVAARVTIYSKPISPGASRCILNLSFIGSTMHDLQDFTARYTAAWCSRNAASVAAFFSPDGSLTINNGTPSVGRAAITEAAQSFMTAFPDLRILMERVIERGDWAEYHWTLIGTNNGPGGTGNRVRISGFETWRFGLDGLVAESLGHFDNADFMRQLAGESSSS